MTVSPEGLRINGENTVVTVMLDGVQYGQAQTLKSWSCEPKVVEHDDELIGSDTAAPDHQIRGWTFKLDEFVVNGALNDALLVREQKRVARQRYAVITIGMVVNKRDGTSAGYSLQECEMPPTGFNASGATERVMQSLTGRAKKFNKVTI